MIIYLIRHGETTGDIENRYGGDYDDHLTELGKQQSLKLAERLSNTGITEMYASPLIRAQETAAAISVALRITAKTNHGFKERNGYGILTGLTKEDALKKYPEQVEILKNVHAAVDGAEEYSVFRKRITEALDKICQEKAEEIAIVTHGGPIKLLFRDILKLGEIDVDDCAYVLLESTPGGLKLLEQHGIKSKD